MEKLLEMIKSIAYGSVTIKIQDGKIITIEKTEKIKISWLERPKATLNLRVVFFIWKE